MEILAYSHLTLNQDLEPLGLVTLPNDRLHTLTAMVGAFALGSLALTPAPASAQATLSRNDSGPDVSRLQDRLASLGYFSANSTGFFGSITEDAITRFQKDKGLKVDGVAGSETLSALYGTSSPAPSASGKSSNSSTPPATADNSASSLPTAVANPATAQLQRDLATLGYDPGSIDGIFGDKTASALKIFQKDANLPVNGVPSIATLQALDQALTNGGVATKTATPRVISSNPVPSNTSATGTAVPNASASSPTQITVANNRDAIVVQRGSQTGQIIVQNDPDRTVVQALKTVPVSDRVASIPALNANSQAIALSPNSQVALGIGGSDPYAVQSTPGNALPYVVAVPDQGTSTITKVQAVVPGAYRAQSARGVYVYAGSFSNRRQAEDLSKQLQQAGLDARVAFRP